MRHLGELFREIGEKNSKGGQDTILAHINPQEAYILKALGGSGRTDPVTGGLHFDWGDNDDADGNSYGSGSGDGLGSDEGADYGGHSGGGDDQGMGGGWWSSEPNENDTVGQMAAATAAGLGTQVGDVDGSFESSWNELMTPKDFDAKSFFGETLGGYLSSLFNSKDPAYDGPNPFNEEDATQGWGLAAPGTAARGQQNQTGIKGVNSLGWNGMWNNVFGNIDLEGKSFTNWGALANNVINSPLTQIAAGLLGGPLAAGIVGAGRAAHQGNYGSLASMLASFANPAAGQALGLANSLYNQGPAGILGAVANYGLNTNGLNFGQNLNSLFGNDRGTVGAALTQSLGNTVQNTAIGQGISQLGVNNTWGGGPQNSQQSFSLDQGLGSNGGTGGFDLGAGLVGAGIGAGLLGNNMDFMTTGMGMNETTGEPWGLSDVLRLGVGLYGANDKSYTNNISNLANTVASMGDPFSPQRGQYQHALQQSYTNPQAVYDSQYRAMDKNFYNEMLANASAAGRTTDAYKHGLAREAQFQQYLGDYRKQLAQLAGGNASPGAAALAYSHLQKGALDTNQQNLMNLLYGVNTRGGGGGTGSTGTSPLSSLFNSGVNAVGSGLRSIYDYLSDPYTYDSNYDPQAGTYTGSGVTLDDLFSSGGFGGSGGSDYWAGYTPSDSYYEFDEWKGY